jgi:hypothetical protein
VTSVVKKITFHRGNICKNRFNSIKKFLLLNPANLAWVKQHANELQSTADMKAVRAEKYPELLLTQMGIKHSNQFANAPLMIMARQRQFMKDVMAELLQRSNSSSTTIEAEGRKTTQRYCVDK